MNRACVNCDRIIIFPDIPLPQNYTQKCNACGFDNPSGEDLDHSLSSSPHKPSIEDSWSGTFDAAVDQVFPQATKPKPSTPASMSLKAPTVSTAQMDAAIQQVREELVSAFNQKIRTIETHLNNEVSITREVGEPLIEAEYRIFQREVRSHVAYREVLVCTQSAALIQTCETQLRDFGFNIHPLTQLDQMGKTLSKKTFHVMILDQTFFKGEEGMTLLTRIKQTPLETRRCQVIILVSPNITSGEPQIFYQWGLDLNIHPRDLEKLGTMLRNLMNLRTQMLGPYLEVPMLG